VHAAHAGGFGDIWPDISGLSNELSNELSRLVSSRLRAVPCGPRQSGRISEKFHRHKAVTLTVRLRSRASTTRPDQLNLSPSVTHALSGVIKPTERFAPGDPGHFLSNFAFSRCSACWVLPSGWLFHLWHNRDAYFRSLTTNLRFHFQFHTSLPSLSINQDPICRTKKGRRRFVREFSSRHQRAPWTALARRWSCATKSRKG